MATPVSGSGANGPDTQKHPRVTIGDENGKVYLEDLFRTLSNPQLTPVSLQTTARIAAASVTTAYTPLLTFTWQPNFIQVFNTFPNTTDVSLGLQFGGAGPIVEKWRLEGESFSLVLRENFLLIPASSVLYIKYISQPASGTLRVTVL